MTEETSEAIMTSPLPKGKEEKWVIDTTFESDEGDFLFVKARHADRHFNHLAKERMPLTSIQRGFVVPTNGVLIGFLGPMHAEFNLPAYLEKHYDKLRKFLSEEFLEELRNIPLQEEIS